MAKELTPAIVSEWLALVSGAFDVRQLWQEIGIESPQGKHHLRVILYRMEGKGLLVSLGSGKYRKKDTDKKEIDWQAADISKTLPLILPFDIHKHCLLYPKSIIIVAGGKNEGKTSFLLETIKLNSQRFCIDFYNSETGPEQLKKRLACFNYSNPPPFKTYERYDNFADVIEPDHLSIIDYLDFNSELYLVGTEIDAIFRKTTNTVIIGLQKPPPIKTLYKGKETLIERDLAYGGAFTAKRAALYISLSYQRLKLVYVKTPANPKVNPTNMQWSFKFDENGFFTEIKPYKGEQGGMI